MPGPGASSEHFVIVNNNDNFFREQGNNYGTVLELAGTRENPLLNQVASLATGVQSSGGGPIPSVQVVKVGADICVFLVTSTYQIPNEISAFKYPGLKLVGNYSDSSVPEVYSATSIVAVGGYLYVSYGLSIGSWAIGSGCTLSLAQTTSVVQGPFYMAATPDGKSLVASVGDPDYVDSYAVGPNGEVTERGPYLTNVAGISGPDITADGHYAIFAANLACYPVPCTAAAAVFTINADGSLSNEQIFGGNGQLSEGEIGFVHLSPDERFLYATGGSSAGQPAIITLDFSENPLNIGYSGCTTTLKLPSGPPLVSLRWALLVPGEGFMWRRATRKLAKGRLAFSA